MRFKYTFMKNKLSLILFFAALFIGVEAFQAQKIWSKQEKSNFLTEKKSLYEKENFPSNYEIVSLDQKNFEAKLKSTSTKQSFIELPNSDGSFSRYSIKETSNFDKILQAKFPNIKSYSAQGIDDPTAVAKISVGTDGFHAVIFSARQETEYIDPYSRDNKDYIIYKRSSLSKVDEDFKCQVEASAKKEFSISSFAKPANDGKLRTFRLALVCSGEYAQFHLGVGQQNIPDTATDAVKKAAVLSAMNTSITRINGIFEKDLSVKLELVGNNDNLIFLDETTDGITDGDPNTMIDEVQTICDAQIGSANYDIGHIFSVGGDGLAGLGVICIPGQKARGVTGRSQPVGDPYDIDFVVHELGHQFGATHTQNNDCNRTDATAVEPGSGSTIMGYAGICNPNVQSGNPNGNSDDYFHAVSIQQMWNTIQSSGSCATLTDTNNAAPTANAGLDYSIPKSTPFKLLGTATDADGLSSLTYNWEQLDDEVGTMPPTSTNAVGPMFRSLPSKDVPVRYMPDLSTVVAGNTSTTWEVLPSVARELNFSFFVRDNNAGGGSSARDDMKIDVVDAEAFLVTAPNSAVTWDTGSTQTVTWDKSTTDIAPINCATVNIKLSIDGGLTFPITLKSNTANDGTEDIVIPNNASNKARIMVEAVDNIFYNINATNFIINSTTPTFILNNSDGIQIACNSGNQSVTYNLTFDFVNGFTETATLSATGQPTGSTVVFNPTTINADGNVTMTISNLDGETAQDYEISVLGTSATVTQTLKLDFKLTSSDFNVLTLTSPADAATNISLVEVLEWSADANATSYDVEIATDNSFTNVVSSGNVTTNSYASNNLSSLTEYFWRVKPKNDCAEGAFSSVFSFNTLEGSYCLSTFTDEEGGTEYISNVTFNGINNDSDNDTTDGYQDFTNLNTNVLRDQVKKISVTFDTGGFQDHCYVFIDWNQDFIFDNDTERYDLGTKLEDFAIATFDITIPSNAALGKTRMRVMIEYDDPGSNYGEGACDADHLTEWGETEDYSITIVEPDLRPNNYTLSSTNETVFNANNGTISLDILQDEFSYQVTVVGPSTNVNQALSTNSYFLTSLAPGKYDICITVNEVTNTQCFEVIIEEKEGVVNPDNYLVNSTSETCSGEEDGIIEITANQQEFSYNLTITGGTTNINEPINGLSYMLSDLAPGTYEVCITANEISVTNCYEVIIVSAEQISLKVSTKQQKNQYSFKIDKGTAPYEVFLNDDLIGVSSSKDFDLNIEGTGILKVKTAKECEGVFEKSIDDILSINNLTQKITLIQNPVKEFVEIQFSPRLRSENIQTTIFDITGKLIYKQNSKNISDEIKIPFSNFAKGIYILKLSIQGSKPIKILKQ